MIRRGLNRFARTLAAGLERDLERLRRVLIADDGAQAVPKIVGFAGYRNADTVRVKARIVRTLPEMAGERSEPRTTLAKFKAMLALYRSREMAGVAVRLDAYGAFHEAVSDEEGYVSFEVPASPPLSDGTGWEQVTLHLAYGSAHQGASRSPVSVSLPILRAGSGARWAVISDIDDTIIETGAHNFARNWRRILVDQVADRIAVPGVASLYRMIATDHKAPTRPFFYVSSSPWNLYGYLTQFMERNGLPHGPMFLKDYGIDADKFIDTAHHDHKLDAIETLLAFYPDITFLLIGDNGQHDVEIYAQAVEDFTGRIGAVYIRDIENRCAQPSKAKLLAQMQAAGVATWCGAGFDDAVALTRSLDMMQPGEIARVADVAVPHPKLGI